MKKVSILNINQFRPDTNPEDFYVNTLRNHLETRHKDISLPHKHNFYMAVLFTQGTGLHEVDFISYDVTPGTVFFLNPGQTHHWELSPDTDGYIFFHTREFYDLHYTHSRISQFPFYYSMHNSPMVAPEIDVTATIQKLFEMAFAENNPVALFREHKLASIIDLIYIESTRSYLMQNQSPVIHLNLYSEKFIELEQMIEKHFRTQKSASVYAGMLNVSPKHLNRITQSASGKSTSDVILERVMLEAKRELLLHHNNIADVGRQLGYEDYAYFSRLFKKKTGETPSGFVGRYRK